MDKPANCSVCKDTGIMRYHDIDGMTIYRWMPYKTKPCTYCNAKENNEIRRQNVESNNHGK